VAPGHLLKLLLWPCVIQVLCLAVAGFMCNPLMCLTCSIRVSVCYTERMGPHKSFSPGYCCELSMCLPATWREQVVC
jgi:hypothetical protein